MTKHDMEVLLFELEEELEGLKRQIDRQDWENALGYAQSVIGAMLEIEDSIRDRL